MKSHSKRILSLVFALLMLFQQVMFAAQTVDLFNPELGAKTVDLIPGEDDTNTVDLLTPSEEDSTKTVDLLNPEQPSATIEQQKPIIEKNENKTVDTITPRGDDIVPAEGKKSTTTIVVGGDEIEEGETNENSEISPEEIILPEENEKEEKKDASFEDEEHHENAGVLPWSTDLVKPWSIYRAPKTVYRPGEDLDLTELLVEIKTGRSGSLYNIEDLINDEFTTITRTRKSDGQKVRLDDKIYEDETMTIHMDGCQDLTIDFTVDENLKDEAKAFEAFQQNLIREEFRNGLDFSLYLIKKGEKENPVVAYSLDPHKLTPIGNGVDKKLKDGPLFDLKDINTWDRYDIETIGKVKAILERSAEIKDTENIRKKLITQLAIWNVTSNIIPEEIDATVSEPTEIAPELKPADETKENPEEDKKDEPIEITEPTTPEEETENIEKENEKVEDTKDETVEIKTEEKVEEKAETEENKESEKIEEKAPVQSTVRKIVFNAKEIDVPYDDIELSDEEYELYKELTSLEAVELKNEDEDLKIYEPIVIEETENQYADLVTIGESDIDSIERVATEVTFDAVEYSFQNLYHTLETSSMLGFGQPRDFDVLLKATMKASRKIVKGDKFEVEILSKTLPILNGEEGRANDIQIDGKVVATAEYIAEEHKIVYTFVEDLDTDKVEIEQEFKQIKEEKAALLNMLDVSENLIADAVRGAEGIEDSEGNSEEFEISPEDDNNTIKLVLGNTPVQYSGASFETKKFRLKTTMTAKAIPVWNIPKGWTFDVNIGSYLKPEYDNNSKPILKPLYDPDNPREVVAEPSYNEATHTITYKYVKDVLKTKKIDIDQLLAFDTKAIDDKKIIDVNITVTPKDNHEQRMPTITVRKDDPRTEIPSLFTLDVNQNGEPNLNDGYEFFEYGPSYKVSFNADASPVVENGKVTSINWTVVFDGNGESLNSKNLNLITNFTAVRNSGLKAIEEVNLNGQGVTLTDNDLGDKFLINDSKYFDGHNNSESVYTFKFKTKVDSEQKAYVLDIAAKLRGVKKTGAVRLIMPAYEGARLEMVSPNDMTYSNRTTISGKFTSEDTAEWILTEEVSSGDKGTLPLIERNISENQKLNSLNAAYYGLYNSPDSPDDGKMHQIKGKIEKNNPIAAGKLDGDKTFTPGTIAVYEYKTKLLKSDELQTYTLSDGVISKYRDVDVNVKWSKRVTDSKYPGETITLTSDENPPKIFSTTILKEEDNPVKGNEIDTKIKAVKLWNIDANGKPKKIEYSISQKFDETIGTNLQCGEVYKTYEIARGRYEIQNYISEKTNLKPGEININKQDENGRPLPGATFKIYGLKNNGGNNSPDNFEIEGTSDSSGSIKFTNIPPGVYTLQETKAPEGYEQNTRTDTITVRDDGSVEWTKNLISNAVSENTNQGTSWKSDVKYYNGSFSWPGYMNTLEYTEVDKNNNITSYIMLKPDVNSFGPGGTEYSSTDRSTRVSMFGDNLNITAVQIFDVGPSKREDVRNAMYSKTANQLSLGNDISGIDNKSGKIVKEANYTDGFLGKNVHAIMIPYKRFGVPNPKEPIENFKGWAFLIKITGKINDQNLNSTFSYRWLTMSEPNVNVFNTKFDNAKIEKQTKIESDTLIPALNKRNAAFAPTFTVVNTQAKRTTLNIQKLDDKNNQLSGAEFSLYNSFGQIIRTGTTEVGGKLTFDKLAPGKYTLKETKSPGGYYNPELTFNVFVNPDGSIIYDAVDKNGKQVEEGDLYKVGENNTGGTSGLQGTKRITVIGEPRMYLNESNNYGKRPRVWEEAAYESYSFEAQFNLENCGVGDSWVMDFDDNWNFTQWSGELPVLKVNDQEVAKGEIDYRNNQIKYTLSDTDYVNNHDSFQVKLELNSIRPSKYYVKNNGIYKFRDIINVGENQKRIDTEVNADLKQFYGQDGNVKYITENVDIYKDSSEKRYMMRNIALFNVFGKKYSNGDTVARIYYGSSVNNGREILFGDKQEPAFEPTKVVVYEVLETPNPDNMPLSCGIRPSENPGIYKPLATFDGIKGKSNGKVSDHGVTIDFDKSRVNIKDKYHPQLYDTQQYQFFVTLPVETKKEGKGYVIEQFYEITDPTKFENTYTQTFMAHKAGNYSSMGIAQMRPTLNKGAAIGGNVIIPQPKNYDLTVYNKKQPGEFIVKKVSEEKDNNGNNIPLSGAEFILLDSNGRVIRRNSSNKEGIVEFKGLSEGTYTLKETVPPDKHKATLRTVNVTVSAEGVVSFTGVENDDEIFQVQTNGRSRKVRKTSEQLNEEQILSHHGGYPAFMNIYSKVFEKDGNHVKTRIYLNPDTTQDLGNGPNKKTVLELSASNTNQDITTAVYKVPREFKENIDQYLSTNKIVPSTEEVKIISNKKIEFTSAGEPGRWNGAAYVIEIDASYKEPNPDIGKSIVQDRYINYNWYCDPDFGTFMKSRVGTQLKVSNTEVNSSTPIGNGVVEINDSKKIIQVVNKPDKPKITIVKIDEKVNEDGSDKVLPGATFGLFDKDGKTAILKDSKPYTVKTGTDGKAIFEDVKPGTYIIRELEAPIGYEKTDKVWRIVVKDNNTVKVFEKSETPKQLFAITNPRVYSYIKSSDQNKTLLKVKPQVFINEDGTYTAKIDLNRIDDKNGQIDIFIDYKNFIFYDNSISYENGWKGLKLNERNKDYTFQFKFSPKGNLNEDSYYPIRAIAYEGTPIENEYLPILRKLLKGSEGTNSPAEYDIISQNNQYYFWDDYGRNICAFYSTIEPIEKSNSYNLYIHYNSLYNRDLDAHMFVNLNTNIFDVENIDNYTKYRNGQLNWTFNANEYIGAESLKFKITPKADISANKLQPIKSLTFNQNDIPEQDNDGVYLSYLLRNSEPDPQPPKPEPDEPKEKEVEVLQNGTEFSFKATNIFKGYNVKFIKYENLKNQIIKIAGAEFKIQVYDGKEYKDFTNEQKLLINDISISDINGIVEFKGLRPGKYRLIETKAPAVYRIPKDPVKYFEITEEGKTIIYHFDKNNNLVEDTSDRKFMIKNDRVGDGEFELIKYDPNEVDPNNPKNKKPLEGVEFELYKSNGEKYGETVKTDKEGKISFKNLPFDRYTLREFKTLPGYILDTEEKTILIGKQWDVPKDINGNYIKGSDVSRFLKLDKTASIIKSSSGTDTVRPNKGELISANLKFNIVPEDAVIKPGDKFTLFTSQNVDLDSISRVPDYKYDIYGPAGRLAAAKIGNDRKSITYTFTEYLESATLTNLNIGMLLVVDRFTVKNSGKIYVAIDFKDSVNTVNKFNKEINVDYTYFKDYDLNGCLVKYIDGSTQDPSVKDTFRVIYYIKNYREKDVKSYGKKLELYSDDVDFSINEIKAYKVESVKETVPWSFGLNLEDNSDVSNYGLKWVGNYFYENPQGSGKYIINLNPNDLDKSEYVVEVKGTVNNLKDNPFTLKCKYSRVYRQSDVYNRYYDTPMYEIATVYKRKEESSSSGATKFILSVPNYKNKIEYTKVDGTITGAAVDTKPKDKTEDNNKPMSVPRPVFSSAGNPLKGAKFVLKKDGSDTALKDSGRTSGENGKFSWEGLAKGKYEVWETQAPEGYKTPEKPVSSFEVNDDGEIINIKDSTTIIKNYKNPEIEFQKVDGENNSVKLKGAKFTLYMAEKHYISKEYIKKDGNLQFAMVDRNLNVVKEYDSRRNLLPDNPDKGYTVESSNEEGTFKFEKLKDGIYAVKETKAPKDYAMLLDYALIFKVEGGKIYEVNKAGNYVNKAKIEVTNKEQANLLVDIETGKAQVNPIQIENFKAEYPATGGVGTLPFVFIGMMIMMVGAYMFIRRRDALYE